MVTRHGGLTTVVCRSTTVRSDASIFNLAPSLPLSYVGCRQFHQLPRTTPTAQSLTSFSRQLSTADHGLSRLCAR